MIRNEDAIILQRIDERRNEIAEKYNVSLPVLDINVTMDRAADFYMYSCCDLFEDPEFFLFGNRDATALPDRVAVFNNTVDRLHNHYLRVSSSQLIGERLRKARKEKALTGEKVVQLWQENKGEDGTHCTTTTATISNHEKGKVSSIRLIDLLRYCYIYEGTTPNEIMLGCSFAEFVNDATMSLHQNDKTLSEQQISHLISFSKIILRALLIKLTDSRCEGCGIEAPFVGDDNIPFLMLHQIDPIKGNDLTNYAVLCPVCNAKITNLKDSELNKTLSDKAASHRLSDLFVSKNQ